MKELPIRAFPRPCTPAPNASPWRSTTGPGARRCPGGRGSMRARCATSSRGSAPSGATWYASSFFWEDFQPDPESVDGTALAHLEVVADAARDAGTGLDVTFFTGHMSGPNWVPTWLLGGDTFPAPGIRQVVSGGAKVVPGHYRTLFTDPVAITASRLLLTAVVTTWRRHPAIRCWNLGNEPDLFSWPPDHLTGGAWVRQMADTIKSVDDVQPVTCGLHVYSLQWTNGLRVPDVIGETDFAVMHTYQI